MKRLLAIPALLLALAACNDKPDPLADHVKCSDFVKMSVTDQSELASFQLKLNTVSDTPNHEQMVIDEVAGQCVTHPHGDAQAFAYDLLRGFQQP